MAQTMTEGFSGIQAHLVDVVWDQVAPFIQAALDHTRGEFTLEEIWVGLHEKEMQLWVLWEDVEQLKAKGAAVTRLEMYGSFIVCQILTMGGISTEDQMRCLDVVENWAKQHNAKYVRWWGRKGLEKMTKPYGYVVDYLIMTKELDTLTH